MFLFFLSGENILFPKEQKNKLGPKNNFTNKMTTNNKKEYSKLSVFFCVELLWSLLSGKV